MWYALIVVRHSQIARRNCCAERSKSSEFVAACSSINAKSASRYGDNRSSRLTASISQGSGHSGVAGPNLLKYATAAARCRSVSRNKLAAFSVCGRPNHGGDFLIIQYVPKAESRTSLGTSNPQTEAMIEISQNRIAIPHKAVRSNLSSSKAAAKRPHSLPATLTVPAKARLCSSLPPFTNI